MKKLILFTWLSFAPFFINAQHSVKYMIKTHEQLYGTNQFELSGNFIEIESEDGQKASINHIIVDIAEIGKISNANQKKILWQAKTEGFEEYIEVRESETKMNILAKENGENIEAILFQINSDEEIIHL